MDDPIDDRRTAGRLAPDEADARFFRRAVLLVVLAAVALAIWRASDLLILAFGSAQYVGDKPAQA